MDNGHKFVFIGGLHRSGTSLFFKSLKTHPDISGFSNTGVDEDEGQFLQSVYPIAKRYGGPGKFGFAEDMHLTEKSPLVSAENRTKLFQEWSKWWNLNKPVLVEKSPPNIIKTRFLQALFPEAAFILLIRHPIAVALATKKWSYTSLRSLIAHWVRCHSLMLKDRVHLKQVMVLRYEDFVQDPNRVLQTVFHMLDLKPIPFRLEMKSGINEKYFDQWQTYRKKWVNQWYFHQIEKRFETEVNRFGYSLVSPERYQSFSL
ncbi:MAG: sulfotransferase [Candidatus Neomarinimicrobiota bacterium]|nr:MAG: sulfotransferase [Candidatus Neomarinimicrobiota bacterium]